MQIHHFSLQRAPKVTPAELKPSFNLRFNVCTAGSAQSQAYIPPQPAFLKLFLFFFPSCIYEEFINFILFFSLPAAGSLSPGFVLFFDMTRHSSALATPPG